MLKKNACWILLIGLCTSVFPSSGQTLLDVRNAIQKTGAKWRAEENIISQMPPDQRHKLCGSRFNSERIGKTDLIELEKTAVLPSELDWRNNNGNWLTSVKDQGACGSCWAFGATGQVESWYKIHLDNPGLKIDLSEQILLSCTSGGCDGGWAADALEYYRVTGVPGELCLPYGANDAIPCETVCPNWQNIPISIPGWGFITLEDAAVETIKNALMRHPVTANFMVYEDFYYYSSGVYEHVWGEVEGGHAILIVGWNDAEQSWICKNSWSPDWGLSGYFKIKWGQCQIGKHIPYIWDTVMDGPALTVSDNEIQLSLEEGETQTTHLIVTNQGSGNLEFSASAYIENLPPDFQSVTLGAWDDLSLWNGDSEIGGYGDHWLQYMDLPALDLSATTQPELRFMINWAIEPSMGAAPPWDGWDGTNVWCSVDGGEIFNPIVPQSPAYTCQSLWSFGDSSQGWDMGPGIPGWAGSSGGWTQALFNLTDYRENNVILRFSFASDLSYSTPDDPSINGVFLDDLLVLDGEQILAEWDGTSTADFSVTSFGGEDAAVDWLSLSNSGGLIESGMNTAVELDVNAESLDPGDYTAILYISSNDNSQAGLEIPVHLEVAESQTGSPDPETSDMPGTFHLNPVYPNPFNNAVAVSWKLKNASAISVQIYDLNGRHIVTLWDGEKSSGSHLMTWNAETSSGTPVSSGVYLIRATVGHETRIRKAVLVR